MLVLGLMIFVSTISITNVQAMMGGGLGTENFGGLFSLFSMGSGQSMNSNGMGTGNTDYFYNSANSYWKYDGKRIRNDGFRYV